MVLRVTSNFSIYEFVMESLKIAHKAFCLLYTCVFLEMRPQQQTNQIISKETIPPLWEKVANDVLGRHGLSCQRSEGRYHRHTATNSIIHCALTSVGVLARLEPPGLLCSDGMHPDSVLMVFWRAGKFLV